MFVFFSWSSGMQLRVKDMCGPLQFSLTEHNEYCWSKEAFEYVFLKGGCQTGKCPYQNIHRQRAQ